MQDLSDRGQTMDDGVSEEDALNRHYALLDLLLLLFWLLLTGELINILQGGDISIYTLSSGLVGASIVTFTVHRFVIRGEERKKTRLAEYLNSLKNVLALFIDVTFKLIIANGILIYQSLTMDIEPRIVRTKVSLTSESEVTLISLLITLTPGTLVIDVEEEDDSYFLYVHYSFLKAENLSESIKESITNWDRLIKGVFT
ncbi:MAG: Na+/H+ antiporter subunit E [Candidatus Thermoplasmatota archaeon]|nr:Na+/H+ antiporter subunit E [Candidatus Thermoplasmatota archaeon]